MMVPLATPVAPGSAAVRRAARSAAGQPRRFAILRHRTRRGLPNLSRVLSDGAVAGETTGARHVDDRLSGPAIGIRIQGSHPSLRLDVGLEVRQMHIVVAAS